jgi:hypothetical protein
VFEARWTNWVPVRPETGAELHTLRAIGGRASAGAPLVPPAQRTEVYRQKDPDQIELVVTTTAADGTITTSTLVFSARGGLVTQENALAGRMLIETRIAPSEWLVSYLANGVQYLTMRKAVSTDGKIMRQSFADVNEHGEAWEGLLVFERQ